MLVQGGHSTCGTFVAKGFDRFALRRFACAVLCLTLPWRSSAETVFATYQATSPTDAQTAGSRIDDTIAFDIPPQPLLAALRTYSEITGQAVLVDNNLAAGSNSPGVHGNYDKTEALRRLLAGTGLVASYSSDQAFTLKPAEGGHTGKMAREQSESAGLGGIEAVIGRYAGKIQKPIEDALCQSADTRPGAYRVALQLWIAGSGRVERTRQLDAVHDPRRADALHRILNQLTLDPPPPGMPQPITLLLLPDPPGQAPACSDASLFLH
jgi:secretin/TonB-like protein